MRTTSRSMIRSGCRGPGTFVARVTTPRCGSLVNARTAQAVSGEGHDAHRSDENAARLALTAALGPGQSAVHRPELFNGIFLVDGKKRKHDHDTRLSATSVASLERMDTRYQRRVVRLGHTTDSAARSLSVIAANATSLR